MEWIIGAIIFFVLAIFFGTKFPIKDDVMMFCPHCHAYVWCERTVYPDTVYYRCKRNKNHRFKHELKDLKGRIGGDKPVEPPKGYGEDDD